MPIDRLGRYLGREQAGDDQTAGLGSWEEYLSAKWKATATSVERQIARAPVLSLGVALAMGVFLGWMIKRR